MAADLRPTPTELLWMNDIYGFMVGGTMVTMGAVGDRIGRRQLIIICAAVFALASAVRGVLRRAMDDHRCAGRDGPGRRRDHAGLDGADRADLPGPKA